MSLEKRVVSVPLIDGLSDNDDNFASDPPGMVEIAEARWSRDKQIGKRNGLSVTNSPGDGTAVVAAKDLNNVVDLDGIPHTLTAGGTYRQQPDVAASKWVAMNTGAPRPSLVRTDPLVRVALSCNDSDAAIAGDIVCAVWEQNDSLGGVTAYYGFWNVSGDTPKPIAGPTSFTSITQLPRVVSLAGRYFVITGLGGNAGIYSCAYDTTAGTWTVGAETYIDNINSATHMYGLAPDYTQSTYAYLAYRDDLGPNRRIKRIDTSGAVVASKTIDDGDVQHILHNGPLSKLVVISTVGMVEYVADSMSGATTVVTPFTAPPSGAFNGKWTRASIGLVDTTGKMWAARGSSGPRTASTKAYGTQVLQLSTSFVPSYENLIGGVVLSAHFSPVISETGVSYLGVARQGAWYSEDTNFDPMGTLKHPEAYEVADVGFVVQVAVDPRTSLAEFVLTARYGQDAMELFGNGEANDHGTPQIAFATSHLPHLAYDEHATSTGRRLITAYPIRSEDLISGGGGFYRRSIDLARVEPRSTIPTRNVYAQGLRLLGGGNGTTMIDGIDHAELTPPAPEWVAFDGYDPNSFGNGFSTGAPPPTVQDHIDLTGYPFAGANPNRQWGFVVVWEYVDARGNIHRGPPSRICWSLIDDLTGQIGGEGANDHGGKLCFSPWRPIALLGDKDITVTAAIYACPCDGNGNFRKIGTVVPLVDPDNEGQVFVTVTSGGTILSNSVELGAWDFTHPVPETLFTTALGGMQLSPWPSPALLSICSTQSRLWGLNGEDRLDVWYTKPLAKGFAPEWNDTLRVRIPQDGGPAVGIAALDDKVVVFKRTKVFIIEGDGGDAAGANITLRPPRLVSSDIGCDAVESIVEGPFGVLFHSERGFFTLGRDLQYQFAGDRVMDQMTIAADDGKARVVTSSCIIPSEAEVRFTLDTVRGAGDIRGLAWNYRLNRWTRRDATVPTFISNIGGTEWSAIADNSGGNTIWKETPLDWSSTPGMGLTFRSSWVKLNGIAGYGRLWRAVFVLRWYANGIRIRTAQDYADETETWKTWTSTQLAAIADSSGRVELDIRPTRQKCEAVQFLVQEYEGQGIVSGRGFDLIGVTLEVGAKRGAWKRVAAGGRK